MLGNGSAHLLARKRLRGEGGNPGSRQWHARILLVPCNRDAYLHLDHHLGAVYLYGLQVGSNEEGGDVVEEVEWGGEGDEQSRTVVALVKDEGALAPEERLIETRPPDMAMLFLVTRGRPVRLRCYESTDDIVLRSPFQL